MITRLIWTIWTLMSSVPKKADKLNIFPLSLLSSLSPLSSLPLPPPKNYLWPVDSVLSMWGKIMIPVSTLWPHSLYELHGPRCPLLPKRLLNLISHSLDVCTDGRMDLRMLTNAMSPSNLVGRESHVWMWSGYNSMPDFRLFFPCILFRMPRIPNFTKFFGPQRDETGLILTKIE